MFSKTKLFNFLAIINVIKVLIMWDKGHIQNVYDSGETGQSLHAMSHESGALRDGGVPYHCGRGICTVNGISVEDSDSIEDMIVHDIDEALNADCVSWRDEDKHIMPRAESAGKATYTVSCDNSEYSSNFEHSCSTDSITHGGLNVCFRSRSAKRHYPSLTNGLANFKQAEIYTQTSKTVLQLATEDGIIDGDKKCVEMHNLETQTSFTDFKRKENIDKLFKTAHNTQINNQLKKMSPGNLSGDNNRIDSDTTEIFKVFTGERHSVAHLNANGVSNIEFTRNPCGRSVLKLPPIEYTMMPCPKTVEDMENKRREFANTPVSCYWLKEDSQINTLKRFDRNKFIENFNKTQSTERANLRSVNNLSSDRPIMNVMRNKALAHLPPLDIENLFVTAPECGSRNASYYANKTESANSASEAHNVPSDIPGPLKSRMKTLSKMLNCAKKRKCFQKITSIRRVVSPSKTIRYNPKHEIVGDCANVQNTGEALSSERSSSSKDVDLLTMSDEYSGESMSWARQYVSLLDGLKSDWWETVADNLDNVAVVMERNAGEVTDQEIKEILRKVLVLVDSARLVVSRSACSAIGKMIKITGFTKRPEFVLAVRTLLNKAGSCSGAVRRAANLALDDLVCGVPPQHAVRALCADPLKRAAPMSRCAAARLLTCGAALGGGGARLLAERATQAGVRRRLLRTLADLIEDRCADTRQYAERLYVMLRPQRNFEAYFLADVDHERGARLMRKFDALLVKGIR